jgi:hypothetical protein
LPERVEAQNAVLTYSCPTGPDSCPKIDLKSNILLPHEGSKKILSDAMFILTVILFFLTSYGFLVICDRLMEK